MNQKLAAGRERNNRPLLGGLGVVDDGGGSGSIGAVGFNPLVVAESIARFATNVITTGSGSGSEGGGGRGGGGGGTPLP